jgi:hypothetical protein
MKSVFKTIGIIGFSLIFQNKPAHSQIDFDTLNYFIESGLAVSAGEKIPFWLLSNKYGTIAPLSPNFRIRTGIFGSFEISRDLMLLYGADIIDRFGTRNEFFLQQAYAGIKFGPVTIKAGKSEEYFGNHDQRLSSGGLIWSGNSRPLPQVSASIAEYVNVPFTKGYAEIRGGISHGWFEDNQFISGVWMHHKYIFLRLGGTLPVHIEYGMQHFAQWGGKSTNPDYGDLPDDFRTFLKVFLAKGGGDNAPEAESANKIGNHIGSHNFAIDFTGKALSLKFYWQTIFEDASGIRFKNIKDGLWGLKISPVPGKYVSGILVEFVNTTDQSGRFHEHYEDSVLVIDGGNDNYFGHFIYKPGWAYKGMTIGTPLITSPALSDYNNWPVNNKINAFHIGIEGSIKNIGYRIFYTFSKNFGTNVAAYPGSQIQNSILMESTINDFMPWGISTTVAIAFDTGELFEDNVGFSVAFKKDGLLKWRKKIAGQ